MYNISPMRPVRQQPGPQVVSRSISPVSSNQYQTQPPPGMKTILKPKIYEAVEIPYQNFIKMPHNIPPNLDNELKQRIHQLENEVKLYKQQSHRSTPDQSDIINQLTRKIREMENSRPQTADATNKHLQEQCELYFNKFQQCELEKNELIHQLKQNEQHFINLQKYAQQSKEYENRLYHYQREVEIWKKKFNDLDDQRIKQIQELRDEYEKVYSQNFNSMKSSSEQRQKALEDEMHKNRQQLDNITKEAEKWRERCHKEDLDKMSYTQRISELEMVTLHCQKEIDRLTLQNIQKQQENDQLKQKLNQLEFNHIQVQQAGLEGEVKRQKEQLDARQREIDDLKKRNSDLEQQILKQKDKIIEYEFIKGKVNGMDQQLQDSERYKHVCQAQELEINQYKLKINKFENLIQDLRRNEHRLQGDIQRLNDLVRMKDEEITKMQSEYKRNMANLQSQINQFRQQYEKDLGMKQFNQKSHDNEDYSDQIMKLNEEIDHLKKERENLLEVIRQYSDTRDKQDNKSIVMMGEIERLNLLIKNKDEEIDHLQQTIEMLSSQLEQMVQQNDLMKKELDVNHFIYISDDIDKIQFQVIFQWVTKVIQLTPTFEFLMELILQTQNRFLLLFIINICMISQLKYCLFYDELQKQQMPQIYASYIKSSRGKCKSCLKCIIPDGVKLGVNISDRNGYKRIDWYHEQCFGKSQMWGVKEVDVQDIDQLCDGDRKRIIDKLELILFQKYG